jgi:CheY-like chemotaxis protein
MITIPPDEVASESGFSPLDVRIPTDPVVLVVDDEPCIRDLLADMLDAEGCIVLLAANAFEAVAHLQRLVPDLVLSDIHMPFVSGEELCRQMHADPRYAETPVILMSAVEQGPARPCGHVAFISKPFDVDILLDIIVAVLNSEDGWNEREVGA